MSRIAVIGSGSWGTAISLLLHDNGHEVTLWSAIESEIEEIKTKHEHKTLPGVHIPEDMICTTDLEEAMKDRQILILAVPSIYTRSTAAKMKPYYHKGQIVVNVAKGIEDTTLKILTTQIEEEIPDVRVCVLSGPSHAEEVSRRLPTVCVVGAYDKETAETVREACMNKVFRVYISPDMLGIELGGALKNVIALAAGIADGLGYGDNTKAALITRGITEMARLGISMGGSAETFYGLTGMGDLIVTCASMHSRNRRAGILMGQGKTMKEACDEVGQVVEGVYSAKAALALSKDYKVEMPIVEAVNKVLFEGNDAKTAVDELMARDKKDEIGNLPWKR